jgi:hypothetical protein
MANILTLTVEHSDGTINTVRVLPVTKVAFERQYSCGIGMLGDSKREEYVYWLAWDAEHRRGIVVKPFNEWLEGIVDVDVVEEAAPFVPDPSPSASPDSPL